MCGFCGIFKEQGPVDESLLTSMREQMRHRGPDEGKNHVDGSMGMGFRRLKIIDLYTGQQPMTNEKKDLWLVYNGEIYNYQELRKKLQAQGHHFSTSSDAEVILHLYEEYGTACLQHLRGMFAFALWDKNNRSLFAARDRFGIKPFYYVEKKGQFAFSSEIKALLNNPEFSAELEDKAFLDYLTFQYVPDPRTLFSGIFRLPPAHYLVKTPGQPARISRYWKMEFNPEKRPLSHFTEGIQEKLREAVRLHLRSDVPRGAFLSSGVDSAIIAALVREIEPVSTFSVGYAESEYSELEEARATAAYLGTEHHEYIIGPEEFLQHLPALIWHFDEPVADPAAISLYFVARMASQKVTVTLSGEGADEVFGGYGIYREPAALSPVQHLPAPIRHYLFQAGQLLPAGVPGKSYLYRARRPLEDRFLGNAFIFTPREKEQLTGRTGTPSPHRLTAPLYHQVAHLDDIARMQYIDLNLWLPGDILMKADKMTMANSLELRVPYLDHFLFEFAATIPPQFRVRGRTTKLALREAFKETLPDEAVYRPKRGFPVPTGQWMRRRDFQNLFLELLASNGGKYFNRDLVRGLLIKHTQRKENLGRKLWTILVFLLWHDTFIRPDKERPGLSSKNELARMGRGG